MLSNGSELSFLSFLTLLSLFFIFILLSMAILTQFFPKLVSNSSHKLAWVEGLRGFAAALVSLNHAPLIFSPKTFVITNHLPFAVFLGSLGVQIFFCITGMLFAHKLLYVEKMDWNLFFTKRLLRIVPAYFFACILVLIITLFSIWPIKNTSNLAVHCFELLSFGFFPLPKINDFDLSQLLGVNWTLAMEWRFYLVLPIVFILLHRFRKLTMITIVGLALGDMVWNEIGSWVYFVSGALCVPFMYKENRPSLTILAYLGLLLSLMILILHWQDYANYTIQRWGIMTCLFASLVILKPKLFTLKWIMALGTVSYSFYLLHGMTLTAIRNIFYHISDITAFSLPLFTLFVGIILAIATVFASFSFIFIEKPFMEKLKFSGKVSDNQYQVSYLIHD